MIQAEQRRRGKRWALILGCVPFVMLVGALPWVNRVEPMVLGLPFLLFWIFAWIALTPAALYAAYRIEQGRDAGESEDEP